MSDKYSTLYKLKLIIKIDNMDYINIPSSDIISIAIINNYDNATFPIIRIRLYSDLTTLEKITEYPDLIHVGMDMFGNIYRMNDDDKSPIPIGPANNLSFSLKAYIENKNTPTSIMDQYDQGLKKEKDLNVSRKVPIELYCYDEALIHFTRKKAPSIFKDMSLTTIIETIFRQQGIENFYIEPTINQEKYDQVLIPNLNVNEALSFFDSKYGLYTKGTQVYGDIDKMYVCNSDVNNNIKPLPIHVESYKNNSDMGGMSKKGNNFQMITKAMNVSIISETDIEKVLNAENISAIQLNTMDVETVSMVKLYPDISKENTNRINSISNIDVYMRTLRDKISVPDLLHKTKNKYIAETYNARVSERITKIDISGVGFDIGKLKINSRYNLIFESPIRGMNMNQLYRATTVSHVISNLDSNLFIAQTVMNLCSN